MKHYQYFGKNHLLSLPLLIVFCPSPVWRRHISPDLWTKERAKKNPEIYSIKINFNYHFTKKKLPQKYSLQNQQTSLQNNVF